VLKLFSRKELIILCGLIVIPGIGLFLYYVWAETSIYRLVENRWEEILKTYDKIIPLAKVEQTIKRLNPKGYRSYNEFEDAVWGVEYDFPKIIFFRNSIRFRKEFLRRFIDETNKKIGFIDNNIDQLSIWNRWYYQKYKDKILKGENGIISQSILDIVLLLNFDKKVLDKYGLKAYIINFDLL